MHVSSSENRNVLSTATGCSDCSKKLHWEFFNMLNPDLQSNLLSDHSNNTSFKGVVSFIWGGRQMLNNSINKTYCHIICLYLIGNMKFMLWSFPSFVKLHQKTLFASFDSIDYELHGSILLAFLHAFIQ